MNAMNDFDPRRTHPDPLTIPASDTWPEAKHRFSDRSVWAIRSALAAGRPLLLRGEPGIGKSQLARAAARVLGVPFLPHVVNERSERDELFYNYDAVARLALAQMGASAFNDRADAQARLAETNFICPGVLWWAFNWKTAHDQAETFNTHCRVCRMPEAGDWTPTAPDRLCGPVVLIDEIDKADPSVPNGLLECLGNRGFTTPMLGADGVRLPEGAKPPLIMITTNEERELPAAFLRRCLVLQMEFPSEANSAAVEQFLIVDRARVSWTPAQVSDAVCQKVSAQLLLDRAAAKVQGLPKPGAAEFLDILRILQHLRPGDEAGQLAALEEVHRFALKKNLTESP